MSEKSARRGWTVAENVIPAYLGWGNPERDKVSLRLYATDKGDAPRWADEPGGRVAEYAVVERFGPREGDRFLIVRVGDRFTPDAEMVRVAEAVEAVLTPPDNGATSDGGS